MHAEQLPRFFNGEINAFYHSESIHFEVNKSAKVHNPRVGAGR